MEQVAVVTSVIRNQKWFSGVVYGIKSKNLMVFASSLRGFLESVTDSYFSLESVPTDLSLNFNNINKAIKGNLNQPLFSEELENKLIHYEFAARSKQKHKSVNKALPVAEYIKLFDMYSDVDTKELYSLLCEITHPASKSVSCFTSEVIVSENHSYNITSTESDNELILEIIKKYNKSIIHLMKMSLSATVISMRILNLYDFEDVKSDYIDNCKVNDIISEKNGLKY